jgi:hypothetical protein
MVIVVDAILLFNSAGLASCIIFILDLSIVSANDFDNYEVNFCAH